MLRHGHARLLIADEVGLGKTIQAGLVLAELSSLDEGFRAVVLVPASLGDQWVEELRERFRLPATRVDADWLLTRARELPPDVNPWSLPGIYVCSIDLAKRPETLRALEDVTWDALVVDEAHAASRGTARLAAAHAVGCRSLRVLLLTATPPDGDPPQFEAMASIGSLGTDRLVRFRRLRSDVAQQPNRRSLLLQVRLSSAERRMHRLINRYTSVVWKEGGVGGRLAAMVLRKRALSSARSLAASVRRRSELLAALPSTTEWQQPLPLDFEDSVADGVPDALIAAPALADSGKERAFLDEIASTALAASKAESKIRALIRLLGRARQPAIVFTEYRDTLVYLEDRLRIAGHECILLHGGMDPRERAESVARFHASGSVLLATDAASEGLNLQRRCRLVIHFELPWTPARLEQRTGRVDRLGQSRRVHEILLVARHTAERTVLLPLARRARLAREHDARAGAIASLTEARIAAAIIGREPLDDSSHHPPSDVQVADLEHEALADVRRAENERRHGAGCSADTNRDRPLATSFRCRNTHALTLLLRVTLRDESGRVVHSELLALRARTLWSRLRRPSELRAAIARLTGDEWRTIVSIADRSSDESLANVAQQHAAVLRSLWLRNDAFSKTLASAASRLAQPGLFDVRVARALAARNRVLTMLADETGRRAEATASAQLLPREVALVALCAGSLDPR